MKNIRKSAIAAATALALTLGGVAAAHAEEATPKLPTDVATQQGSSSEGGKGKDAKAVGSSDKYIGEDGKPSAELQKKYESEKPATGVRDELRMRKMPTSRSGLRLCVLSPPLAWLVPSSALWSSPSSTS